VSLVDTFSTSTLGLRARRSRTVLTAAGIAIGIAAMVSVVGISASSRADLLATLDQIGTNLLQVRPGSSVFGESATLPDDAAAMIRRIGPVERAAATKSISTTVRRSDLVPATETGGISVQAAEPELLDTLGGTLHDGTFLNDATSRYPAAVLGAKAAERLGIGSAAGRPQVFLGGRWFTVIGVLDPLVLAPDIDRSALIGFDVAADLFGVDHAASTIWLRATEKQVDAVRAVLAETANPEKPNEVEVSRPSDALAAKAETDKALTALLLALGGVALLVGGVGIANVMVISVLERRNEIGLRRALGATRRHVRTQFVVEAVLLAGVGGLAGIALGASVTAAYASARSWSLAVPTSALAGGVGIALLIGALAGLYPAARAARLAPAEAVRPA
jgi:putative ABC transport system permease protein